MENKYHTSKIYKISSPQCEKFYIGSTTQTLKERLRLHKKDYTIYKNGNRGNMTSFDIVKFDDAIIELIKDVKCENRKELNKIEGECIKEHHDRILNKNIAGRTQKQYREAHKDKIKEYYETNKEHYKNTNKEYYEANKEKIKEIKKEYHQRNKEKLNEKFDCDCGSKYTFRHKARHAKSQKHQLFISNQQF